MSSQSRTNDKRLQKLREVLKNAKELSLNKSLRQEDLDVIRELWDELEACLKEAKGQGNPSVQEMILDLQVIYSTSCYIGQHIRELQTSATQFSAITYAEKLLSKLSANGDTDWFGMSTDAVRIINRAPGMPTLLGTFSPTSNELKKVNEERRKRAIERKPKEALAQKQTAGKVENLTEDKDSVDVKVSHILKVLHKLYKQNKCQPISFYKFILHPKNFTTTVENIFYISFIIRDGLARLDVTDSDDLVISPMKKQETGENSSAGKKSQMVFSITMEEWKNLVAEYGVSEALIQY